MSNEREFFAVTGSIYLRGTSSRKPHDRTTIRATQPEYYKFLGELFDPEPSDTRKAAGRVSPGPPLRRSRRLPGRCRPSLEISGR